MPGIDNGAEDMAGTGDVAGLEMAGSGVFIDGGGNGIVRTGGSGSVLMRRKLLLRPSFGTREECEGGGSCKGPVVPRRVEPGTGLANCGLGVTVPGVERASGRTMRSG